MVERVAAWFAAGGIVMPALSGLGLVLVFLCVELLLATQRRIDALEANGARAEDGGAESYETFGLRRMGIIHACILVAPLLGLLGTVIGITATFRAILVHGYTADMGRGISQALLTTQYGLCIAVPGLLAELVLRRRLRLLQLAVREGPRADGEEGTCAAVS